MVDYLRCSIDTKAHTDSDINQQTQWDSNQTHTVQLSQAFFHLKRMKEFNNSR